MKFFSKKGDAEEFIDIEDFNRTKLQVKIITLTHPEDYKKVISSLASEAISIVNIKPLLQTNKEAVKMSIQKIKRTCRTFEGGVVGFSDDLVVVTPKGVDIFRDHSIVN